MGYHHVLTGRRFPLFINASFGSQLSGALHHQVLVFARIASAAKVTGSERGEYGKVAPRGGVLVSASVRDDVAVGTSGQDVVSGPSVVWYLRT